MSGRDSQLVQLTGLDNETIKEQILPYLATFTSKQSLINHLQDLLGPGVAQQNFIQSFSDECFPPAPPTPSTVVPTKAAQGTSTPPPLSTPKTNASRKLKTKFPSKLPPPRKVDASSFGGVGSVYRKGQDEELLFGAGSSRSATLSESAVVIPSEDSSGKIRTRTPDPPRAQEHQAPSALSTSKTAAATMSRGPEEHEFVLIPTAEMKEVQHNISALRGESNDDSPIKMKPCFCQGRRHELHSLVPLCLSCGLLLCSTLSPSPMHLPSPPCPSCASPLLNTTSRAILLARLDMTLASLTQDHQEKVRLIREERQQAWKEKRQEVDLFPELKQHSLSTSSNIPSGSSKGQEYNYFHERRRVMDIAMGRKVEDDSQRRSRVLRLESKVGRGKGGAGLSKKKKSAKDSKDVRSNVVLAAAALPHPEESEVDAEVEEEREEEQVIDYDYDEEGDGPVPDEDDDGFARHATSFAPDSTLKATAFPGWQQKVDHLPTIRYVAEADRTRGTSEEEEEEKTAPTSRHIPGSAPKEDDKANTKSKFKKGGQQEIESSYAS